MGNFEIKAWYWFVSLGLAALLTVIGLLAEVTWTVVLIRALVGSALISMLVIAMDVLWQHELESQGLKEPLANEARVDIRVESDEDLYKEIIKPEFQPFVPTQVDQEINQLVNRDPQQAADLLRKLGIDE